MKTILALTAALLCVGCGTLSKPIFRPVLATNAVPARVVNQATLVTNFVGFTRTNSTGVVEYGLQTNVVQTVTPFVVPPTFTVVTNGWEQRPGIETGIQVAAGVTNLFAPGVGSIAGYALSGILGVWGAFLNRKAKTATETATGLVLATEDFRKAVLMTPLGEKISDHLIDQIQAHLPAATKAGLLLEQLVDQHTGKTSGPADFIQSMKTTA